MSDRTGPDGSSERVATDSSLTPSVTEAEKELARKSCQEFYKGQYVECMQSLLRLVNSQPTDPKVSHNKSVVEYYLSDFKRTDEFKKNLYYACSQSHINLDDVDSLDDVENCVFYYNRAVLLFHTRQWNAALAILDKVFQFIEPLEENLGRKICFLLLELYLCSHQPEKALGMINFIETLLSEEPGEGGSKDHGGEHPARGELVKEHSGENRYGDSSLSNEVLRPRLQQYKARCYLMLRSLKGCKRELKNLLGLSGMAPASVYLKAHLEYLRGNYRKATKVLNSAASPSKPFVETGENVPVLFFNNMGCIHFYMGHSNLGCFYFQKALRENELAIKQLAKPDNGVNGRPLYTVGANFRYEVLYNLGIQLLHAKKPQQAFSCLSEATQVYHTNPRLWLRLAECCIQIHHPDNEDDFHLKKRKKDMVQGIVGVGQHRKVILAPRVNKKYQASEGGLNFLDSPTPSLEFAMICLRNALYLLPDEGGSGSSSLQCGSRPVEDLDSSQASDSNVLLPAPPGNPIRGSEIMSLRCSSLANAAYVALSIGDATMALHYAELLLVQPKLSGLHKFLAHTYAGEALTQLDRIADSINHFSPNNAKDLSVSHPSQGDREERDRGTSDENNDHRERDHFRGWFPNTLASAQMVLQYNLSVAYTMRGELDKSNNILNSLESSKDQDIDVPVQALMLSMYNQMQQGNADKAKFIIRQNFPQYR